MMLNLRSTGRRILLPVLPLAVFFGAALLATPARAETITLTRGQVSINTNFSTVITADLFGPNFELHVFDDLFLRPPPNQFLTCTVGCGTDGIGRVTFNGVTVSAFSGSGNFDESTIAGSLTLRGNFDGSLDQPPFPFTVDYVGIGRLERTPTGVIFTVSSPVPEPGTLLLLGPGLAAVAAAVRRRLGIRPRANQ